MGSELILWVSQHFCLADWPSQAVAFVGLTKIFFCNGNAGPPIAGVIQLTNELCSERWRQMSYLFFS